MNGCPVIPRLPRRDRALTIHDLLEEIATLKAAGADPAEIDLLVAEYRRLRAEL